MPSATMQESPVVPPRPSRGSEKQSTTSPAASMPKIPPRPSGRRTDRSTSPGINRFAQSPFNESIGSKSLRPASEASNHDSGNVPERPGSVSMPSVGEEGAEYITLSSNTADAMEETRPISPEQTRTVGDEVKLHAPKPSLAANAAKRQVMQVTRTDSDKAAALGLGRHAYDERSRSRDALRKRPSTSFSSGSHEQTSDDDHGIPEIGQRVPMNPHLGDVQAPSPGPGAEGKNYVRKQGARNLPPGSYGMHGHGVIPLDKLERDYYNKHPDLKEREQYNPLHDRQNDYAMSRDDLNKLVRDTPNRQTASRLSGEYRSTPTDEVAFQASERYASRRTTPHNAPVHKLPEEVATSSSGAGNPADNADEVIHVDDAQHPEYRSYGDEETRGTSDENEYLVLASDEVQKDTRRHSYQPAVHPAPERHGSAFEENETPSRPVSRPSSIYHTTSHQEHHRSTPLDDVEEYEPLFDEEKERILLAAKNAAKKAAAEELRARHHFPSKDIWEDAPESVHFSAEVLTPEPEDFATRVKVQARDEEGRSMTPAQMFAQHQEELAEKQRHGPNSIPLPRSGAKPNWASHQAHLQPERPAAVQRFPSRDIWEDVPESQLHSATLVSQDEEGEDIKSQIPEQPIKKSSDSSDRPAIPDRPKPKQSLEDEVLKARPVISDKPKPQIPSRPTKKVSGDSKEVESAAAKPKPPVPSRPVGGKIAALQAGFMSDLNKRLQLGPQAHKKEEPKEEEPVEPEEKAPLVDARKSRARGPQRRAPAKTVTKEIDQPNAPVLSFSMPQTSWAIDPDAGRIDVDYKKAANEEVRGLPSDEPTAAAIESEAIEANLAGEAVNVPEPDKVAVSNEPVLSEEPPVLQTVQTEDKDVRNNKDEETNAEPNEDDELQQNTLVANTAGESILEADVVKKGVDEVEPLSVKDEVQS